MKTQKDSQSQRSVWGILAQTIKAILSVCVVAVLAATLFTSWPATGIAASFVSGSGNGSSPAGEATATAQPDYHVGLVVGHWGNDSGAVCPDSLGGYKEVDINYIVADLTQQYLRAYGVTVDLLKEFDDDLEGYESNALVSIHADTCERIEGHTSGFKIAETKANQRPEQATRLLRCLENRYAAVTGLSLDPDRITVDMTEYHAFDEIHPNTPAVIIETGYMNQDQYLLIKEPDRVARGIADGIMCYLKREPISPEE